MSDVLKCASYINFEKPTIINKTLETRFCGYCGFEMIEFFYNIEKEYNKNIAGSLTERDIEYINIYLNTPGGYAADCFHIMNFIETWNKNKSVKIAITGSGSVCSAGIPILLSTEYRHACRFTKFMLHELQSGIYGSTSRIKDYVVGFDICNSFMQTIILEKTTLTEKELDAMLFRHDSYFDVQYALEKNIINSII